MLVFNLELVFSNKILTSARNGELIMWDLNKSGSTKLGTLRSCKRNIHSNIALERRSKDHSRSINAVKVSPLAPHYCVTGSADGDLRMWVSLSGNASLSLVEYLSEQDLRDISQSVMRISTSASVRSIALSPLSWQPMLAIAGLDNGTIFKFIVSCLSLTGTNSVDRWEVSMSQRGLATIALAHTGPVTTLDWHAPQMVVPLQSPNSSGGEGPETSVGGMGWLASGGLDRTVKVRWCMFILQLNANKNTGMGSHIDTQGSAHASEAGVHSAPVIPCSTRSLASVLRMRAGRRL